MDYVDACVLDHVIDLVLLVEDPTARRVRRALQQEEDSGPCDQPSPQDLQFFVAYMLIDAEAKCEAEGVDLEYTDWDKISSDLVSIFSSPQCWGLSECTSDEPSSIDYAESNHDDYYYSGPTFVVTDDGHQCIFQETAAPDLQRKLVLSYFYQVETSSTEEPSLEAIERAMIDFICSGDVRRSRALKSRALEHDDTPIVVAVDSSPGDSIYATCELVRFPFFFLLSFRIDL